MLSYSRERQITARLPQWQQEQVRLNEQEHAAKCGIPVRRVAKGSIPHTGILQLQTSAFIEAGEYIREAIADLGVPAHTLTVENGHKIVETMARTMRKEDMIKAGIWPLMSKGWDDPQTRLGMVNGEYDKWNEADLQEACDNVSTERVTIQPARAKAVHMQAHRKVLEPIKSVVCALCGGKVTGNECDECGMEV